MTVACTVLNWNDYQETKSCIDTLQNLNGDYEIFVIDNGSVDGSGRKLDNEYPNVTVLYNLENFGFSGGMNTGIKKALQDEYEYIWLLNNDVRVQSTSLLNKLVHRLETSDYDAMSPLVESPNGEVWFEYGSVDRFTGISRHRRVDRDGVYETDYLPLCSALVDSKVFRQVGLLNEDYFIYVEDIDFALRASQQGYSMAVASDLRILHDSGHSTGGDMSDIYSYYNTRNHILLVRDNKQLFNAGAHLLVIILVIYELAIRLYNCSLSSSHAVLLGAIHGYRSIRGKAVDPNVD